MSLSRRALAASGKLVKNEVMLGRLPVIVRYPLAPSHRARNNSWAGMATCPTYRLALTS